jgi:uncharacterized membrane protein YciS (DUF1049 family)
MKLLKNLLTLLVVLAIFIYGVLFSIYNEQGLNLDFLFLDSILVPLSLWSGCLIILGVALGLLFSSVGKIGLYRDNKRLNKELEQAKKKLEKLNH